MRKFESRQIEGETSRELITGRAILDASDYIALCNSHKSNIEYDKNGKVIIDSILANDLINQAFAFLKLKNSEPKTQYLIELSEAVTASLLKSKTKI